MQGGVMDSKEQEIIQYSDNAGRDHVFVFLPSCPWQKPMKFPLRFCIPVNTDQ
jgi:hypothetical protein